MISGGLKENFDKFFQLITEILPEDHFILFFEIYIWE